MFVPITPAPKPRMTQADRWKKRPAVLRYRAFCDELRLLYKRYALPSTLYLEFHISMPHSWSTKKKTAMLGQPHKQKPDIDNLAKAVMDALYEDDSFVFILHAEKYWADDPGIEIRDKK